MSGCGSAVLPYAASATVLSLVLSPLPQKTPPICPLDPRLAMQLVRSLTG